MSPSPWTLRLQLALAALGPGPLLLAAGVAAVLLLWLVAVPAAQGGRDAALAEWKAAQAAGGAARDVPAPPPADALAEFNARLSGDEELPRLVQQIWRQAGAAGLQVSKVDWRAEHESGQRFGRVHIVVPMTGPYTAMRRFSFNLLAAWPGLALTRLDMKREQAAAGAIETTAHFTLYVRP